jgi:hypothetical protein
MPTSISFIGNSDFLKIQKNSQILSGPKGFSNRYIMGLKDDNFSKNTPNLFCPF